MMQGGHSTIGDKTIDSAKESITVFRPRFQQITEESTHNIELLFTKYLATVGIEVGGKVSPGFIVLFPKENQHFWSPELTLRLEKNDNNLTEISGLYGPKPSTWTLFIFFYAVVGLLTLFVSIIGFSSLTVNGSASILWLLPVLIGLFLSIFWAARIGKKLSKGQMKLLEQAYLSVISKISNHQGTPTS